MTNALTARSRFVLRAAAAINGSDPWVNGYSEYSGTFRSLMNQMPRIERNHGGNVVTAWFHHGQQVSKDDLATAFGVLWTDI